MGKRIALALAFIIVFLLGVVGGFFLSTKTSFPFGKQSKLTGVWSSGNKYLVIKDDGTFFLANISSVFDETEEVKYLRDVLTGHINKDLTMVYTGRYSRDFVIELDDGTGNWINNYKMVTPLDQLSYTDYAYSSSLSFIDDTTLKEDDKITYIKKFSDTSMDFRDFVE
jgi:hypothetical protein